MIDDSGLLKRFGITRVGDITDLDIVGIPVWFAVRPNSRGLSVSQGKGITARQARLSAVMEAIEGAVAEDTQRHVKEYGSLRMMQGRRASLVPLSASARVDMTRLDPDRERAWVQGYSVRTDSAVFAPYELVGMDFRADFPWDRLAFHMSSQGLAAGFDHDRTILHALLELIENDACFAVDAFATRQLAIRSIALPTGVSEDLDGLLNRLENIDLSPRLFDLTSANGVPVIMAALPRSVVAPNGPGTRISAGVACRLDIYDAAVAALLEAIQSRLTDISGARDDLSADRYDGDKAVAGWRSLPQVPVMRPVSIELASGDMATPVWRRLADHLFAAGVDDIYVFPLESGVPGITVIRVLGGGLAAASGGVNSFSVGALHSLLRG
ncbi:YcaO-like family protein [Rhizobium terrae]|uniref:YcaO-like family protein n=1 Tax=Rhizobium terrae TaxID=2171756 RepID=UPI001D01A5F4|nr:YcaO-like family protein [Rhizobium terrae]